MSDLPSRKSKGLLLWQLLPNADESCSSGSSPKEQQSLMSLPPEILGEIASHLAPEDRWSLKLTCHLMNGTVRSRAQTHRSWSSFQNTYESANSTKRLMARACHQCHKVRFIAQFPDDQRNVKKVPTATCIPCRIDRGDYEFGRRFTVNGLLCWPCNGCLTANPLSKAQPRQREWSEKRWCPECWDKGVHLTAPRTRWPENDGLW